MAVGSVFTCRPAAGRIMEAFLRGIVAKLHRLRPESIGNGHAYSATGVTRRLARYDLQPGSTKSKTTMKKENYAALVALD